MVRQGSFYIYIVHIYIRALLPYDCRSCNGCHHQYVFTNIVFIIFFIFYRGKYKHIVLIIKANLSFFLMRTFFLKFCCLWRILLFTIKKKGTDYETETSDYYRCDYCHCFIIVLAFYSRRLECLAQCKLIFQYYHARLFG